MLVAWVYIDTDQGVGIAGTICVECLKIIDRSECVMEVAFRQKAKKHLSLAKIPCGLPQMPFPKAKRKALADRGPV